MIEQATDGGYSEHYVRSLEAERDRLAAEVEKWKERCAWKEKVSFEEWEHLRAENGTQQEQIATWNRSFSELAKQVGLLEAENAELVTAAEQVIIAHDKILPIMNAYMSTLGTIGAWEISCAASDALRAEITKVKEK